MAVMKTKNRQLYSMHFLDGDYFKNMININVWWDDWERHIKFYEHYDIGDRIMNLNFYNNFKDMYKIMRDKETTVGGRLLKQLLAKFKWDKDVVEYVRGKRQYPGVMDWIEAKRFFAVMNLEKKYFMTLDIILNEGVMNVYDYNVPIFYHWMFLIFIEPVLEYFPILLMQSNIMKYLSAKLLNE